MTLGTPSHIDHRFCSHVLYPHISWKIEKNLFGCDHFPIVISLFSNNGAHRELIKPKFNLNFAEFQQLCESLNKTSPMVSNINKGTSNICKTILQVQP